MLKTKLVLLHSWQRKHTDVLYICISRPLIITDHLMNSVEHRYKVDNLLLSLDQGATVGRCAPEHNSHSSSNYKLNLCHFNLAFFI